MILQFALSDDLAPAYGQADRLENSAMGGGSQSRSGGCSAEANYRIILAPQKFSEHLYTSVAPLDSPPSPCLPRVHPVVVLAAGRAGGGRGEAVGCP